MQHTDHYNLNLPQGLDLYDVQQFNQNARIIDNKLYEIETEENSHVSDKDNPHEVNKVQVGLGNVDNKSSETIRNEITKLNVTNALGYEPTAVIGNPTGTPTTNLQKIKIGNTIYQLNENEGTVTDVIVDGESVVDAEGVALVRIKANTYYYYEIAIGNGVSYYVRKFNSAGERTENNYYSTPTAQNTDDKFTTSVNYYSGTQNTYLVLQVTDACNEFPVGTYTFDCPSESGAFTNVILTYKEGYQLKNISPAYNELKTEIGTKQNKLTPGANISIQNDTISVEGMPEILANVSTVSSSYLNNLEVDGTSYKVSTVQANASTVTGTDLQSLTVDNIVYNIPDGVNVVANPTETGSTDLNSIKIDQTVYNIPEGTLVEANPQETGTIDLTSIKVDETVYNIPQGGGSSVNIISGTLLAASWSSDKTQVISAPGVTASNASLIGLDNEVTDQQRQQAKDANLIVSSVSTDSITVKANGLVPFIDIPITVIIFN